MIRDKIECPYNIDWENPRNVDLYHIDFLGLQEYLPPSDLELARRIDLKVGDLVFALKDVHIGYNDFGPQTADCKMMAPCKVVEANKRLWLKTIDNSVPSFPPGTGFLDKGTLLDVENPLYKRKLLALPHLKS